MSEYHKRNLQQREDELDLAKHAHESDAEATVVMTMKMMIHKLEVDVGPELKQGHADGCDLRPDGQDVAVDEIPSDGEAERGIDQEFPCGERTSPSPAAVLIPRRGRATGTAQTTRPTVAQAEERAQGPAGLDGTSQAKE